MNFDRHAGEVVLIVDDVPDNLSVLHDALDESGYTVLVARLGAAWKTFVSDVPGALTAIESMRESWTGAGRAAGDLYTTAWACGCVLEPGEPALAV